MGTLSAGPKREREAASPRAPVRPKVVLVGFMGAGKSALARLARERLGQSVADADALIEERLGEPIATVFERRGEAAFREEEERTVLELLARPDLDVVAVGGGALGSDRVGSALAGHVTAYVEVGADAAWERAQRSDRPLARDRGRFDLLLAERSALYERVARAIVCWDGDPSGPADRRLGALEAALRLADARVPHSVRMLWARAQSGGYPVFVGADALTAAGSLWPATGRSFLVADEAAQSHHGAVLAASLEHAVELVTTIVVPPGEGQKSLAEAERVLRALAGAGMQRSDTLAALGGGVVGDLAGFCAATYQRGVPLVQIPTTLVAQVDSAYGGKTGVDLPEAKNYVGAFHQPATVLTDPRTLSTLPAEERSAGFAEVVKTGLIEGDPLWSEVQAMEPVFDAGADPTGPLTRVIEGCIRTKLSVVARDERDTGVRASLNLGHTFAHALESATGYRTHRHGEAVAVGLLVALRMSERELGLDSAVRLETEALLRRHGLPTSFDGPATEELLDHAARDKKRAGERPNLVLLRAPGDVVTGADVEQGALAEAIEAVRSPTRSGGAP